MPSRTGRPGSHTVVGTDEIIAGVDGIVAVCLASDKLPIDKGATVAALVMRTQRICEGRRRRGEKWRGERAGRSFGEQADASFESKGQDGRVM